MGEYAHYNGQQIKIGTCEDMYYLRFQQRHEVASIPGNVDLDDLDTLQQLRFRFPFPDEDSIEPGGFDDYKRGFRVPGCQPPEDIDHGSVQFSAPGYVVSLPCPESTAGKSQPHQYHGNGHPGPVQLVAQKLVGSELWAVCRCGGCGSMWRLDKADGLELAASFLDHALTFPADDPRCLYHHTIGHRIAEGYLTPQAIPTMEEAAAEAVARAQAAIAKATK